MAANLAEWEVGLTNVSPGEVKLAAHAEDAAGNVENLVHEVVVNVTR